MKQELEIEFKNLLSKAEFLHLLEVFSIKEEQFVLQENHYFDTRNFSLKEQQSALRIRKKKGMFTLTLKQPVNEGMLETHEPISFEDASELLNNQKHVSGKIAAILSNIGINPTDLVCFGSLKTKRAEINYKNGLLVFDHSYYDDTEDYEVEYEVQQANEGKQAFRLLLESNNIPLRKTKNKIQRFFDQAIKANK